MSKQHVGAKMFLEKELGRALTLGIIIRSVREKEQASQIDFAKKLGISKQHLCDIEKERRIVSIERAIKWARTLGCHEIYLAELVLQE